MEKFRSKRSAKLKILVVIMLFGVLNSNAQQADFSGTWIRNTEKCDPGKLSMNSIPVQIVVSQNTGQIDIRRVSRNYKGDTTDYTEKVKFVGPSTSSVIRSSFNKTASIRWAEDQKQFIETANYTDDNGNALQSGKEIWFLDEIAKSLKIRLTLNINGQDFSVTEIFDKK